MFRKIPVKFKFVELPAYVIEVKKNVHRIIRLDNDEFLYLIFDKDGSIFDVRKYKTFEFIKRHFERYGLHLECEPNSNNFAFEYITTKRVSYNKNKYLQIYLPIELFDRKFEEFEVYKGVDDSLLLIPRENDKYE